MRGSQILSRIFEPSNTSVSKGKLKGRSELLMQARNQALLNRLYFYFAFTDLKYEKVIEIVSGEFYLRCRTVTMILEKEATNLSIIKKEKPTLLKLQREFPHFNWKFSADLIHVKRD